MDAAIKQTGGASFAISGSTTAYMTGGSLETTSPIEISDPNFITAGNAKVTTTGVLTFAKGLVVQPNGGDNATFTAAGIGPNTGATYGLAADSLILTGGKTTVASSSTLRSGPITLQGGELDVEGEVEQSVRLTGGKLLGNGTLGSSVTNTAGTVEPGSGGLGTLHLDGSFTQEAGGTLAVTIKGTTPGTGFGQLVAQLTGQFGGHVAVLDEGFTPVKADRFLIVETKDGNGGTFSGLTGASGSLYEAGYEAEGAYLAPAPLPAPVNTKAPEITGTPLPGETLSCSTGTWTNSPESYAYEWRLEGVQITGQSTATLELTPRTGGQEDPLRRHGEERNRRNGRGKRAGNGCDADSRTGKHGQALDRRADRNGR